MGVYCLIALLAAIYRTWEIAVIWAVLGGRKMDPEVAYVQLLEKLEPIRSRMQGEWVLFEFLSRPLWSAATFLCVHIQTCRMIRAGFDPDQPDKDLSPAHRELKESVLRQTEAVFAFTAYLSYGLLWPLVLPFSLVVLGTACVFKPAK